MKKYLSLLIILLTTGVLYYSFDTPSQPIVSAQGVGNYFGDATDGNAIINKDTYIPNKKDGDYVVKQYDSLWLDSGYTLTTAERAKGLFIYVCNDAIINGTISMTARGAAANPNTGVEVVSTAGLRLPMFKDGGSQALSGADFRGAGEDVKEAVSNQPMVQNGTVYTIAKYGSSTGVGGKGGAGQSHPYIDSCSDNITYGGGNSGTAFSGGAGGGGSTGYFSCHVNDTDDNYGSTAGSGQIYGGTGGYGGSIYCHQGCWSDPIYNAGGGAGNPGGAGSYLTGWSPQRGNIGEAGDNGTGGVIWLVVGGNLTINGEIEANGSDGGAGFASGGGSGGGAIRILYAGDYTKNGVVQATGGKAGTGATYPGVKGANGTVIIDKVDAGFCGGTVIPTVTPTATVTPTVTIIPTITPTVTVTPTATVIPTITPTVTVTPTATVIPTITPTVTVTPTATVIPTITPTVTVTPTTTPTITPSPVLNGDILINEINHSPKADWSAAPNYTLSGRGEIYTIDNDDQFIELYINKDDLDLTDPSWQIIIYNNTTPLLTAGTEYLYIGVDETSTQIGDYLLITNPISDIPSAISATIEVKNGVETTDIVTFNQSYNYGLLQETYGRNATSTDVVDENLNPSDFSRNHGTPGKANTPVVANIYEAEIYTESYTGKEHGIDIKDTDNGASNGHATLAENGKDLDGNIFSVSTSAHNPAGAYQAKIKIKTLNANINDGVNKFADFVVTYPDGLAGTKETGFAIVGRDIKVNNVYQEFTINFVKPATTGVNTYSVGFFNGGGADIIVDYISVTPVTAATTPLLIAAESMHLKAGYVHNDGGNQVVLGPKSESTTPTHIAYGPYTSAMISTLNSKQYEATFRIKFDNLTNPSDLNAILARIDVYNPHENISRESLIRVGNISGNGYADYKLVFPSASEGTFQFRIVNWGNADIYFDYVFVTEINAPINWRYESENDFSFPNNATIVNNPSASNGHEVVSTVASNNAGFMIQGPYTIDQTNTGDQYKAIFRLRTNTPSNSSNYAAMLIVRNFDTGKIIANSYIPAVLLSTTYKDFSLYFPSLVAGRIDYEVVFLDEINVISDYVLVDKITSPILPRHMEVEYMYSPNGVGMISSTSGVDVLRARNGIDDQSVLLYSNSQEVFAAHDYNVTFSVKKTGVGNTSNKIAYLEVWSDNGQGNLSFYELQEDELTTSGFSQFDLPFTMTSPGNLYYKIYFVGGLGNDIEVDKIILNTI